MVSNELLVETVFGQVQNRVRCSINERSLMNGLFPILEPLPPLQLLLYHGRGDTERSFETHHKDTTQLISVDSTRYALIAHKSIGAFRIRKCFVHGQRRRQSPRRLC